MKSSPLALLLCLWLAAVAAGAETSPTSDPAARAPLVTASPVRGFYDGPVTITLAAKTNGVVIRYTTDGDEPTATHGAAYTTPLPVAATTILRAAAFAGNQRVSAVATHSYLFLAQVARQPRNPPGFPNGQSAWNGFPSVYGMDERVTGDAAYQPKLNAALRALPTLSVVCPRSDLFSQRTGIYVNSLERGDQWERACSVEWLPPDGGAGFAINGGIQMQGNYNRLPDKSPKHSFRLLFKERYGPSKLRFPIFPGSPVTNFNTLVLRAGYNNTWIHWDERANGRADLARDAWMKDTQRAMGGLAGRNRFVHLYLNGLYWGIYDIAERPDDAFAAAHLGGKREDYEVINEWQVKAGPADAAARLRGLRNLASPARYEQLTRQLDVPRFIDYALLNFYAGNQDWGERKNWYVIRRREPSGPFQFLAWDGEHTLEKLQDNIVQRPFEMPFRLLEALRANPEFQLAFAERARQHCLGNGALTPKACADRWSRRAGELDMAIIAESARWGYYRRNPPFTRDQDWLAEQRRLLSTYFPKRTDVLLRQLRDAGLYSSESTAGPGN